MKRPAIFFDRDNTLIVSDGYLGEASNVVLNDGAAEAVARAQELGFKVVVISNQSGVARGLFSEADVNQVNDRLDELLLAAHAGAVIDRHEYCPFHPAGTVREYREESERRKPAPGMILDAARIMALDVANSWVVGDAARDVEAGHAAGCRTVWLRDPRLAPSPAGVDRPTIVDYTASSLGDAMEFIAAHRDRPAQDGSTDAPPHAARPDTAQPVTPVAVASTMVSRNPMEDDEPKSTAAAGEEGLPVEVKQPPMEAAPAEPPRVGYRRPALSAAEVVAAHARGTAVVRLATPKPDAAPGDPPPSPSHAPAVAPVTPPAAESARPAAPASPAPAARASAVPWPAAPARPAEPRQIPAASSRVEHLLAEILTEIRRGNEQGVTDFSVSKLMAGITQAIVLFVLFTCYMHRDSSALPHLLMLGLILQTFTIALLIMSRQR